ncbi:[acyl-carrier-protein] S-malonyltransferase [Nannocystis exedens]|uniref:[acyl-carrier-protein] S-malonyltransferase n=1 Tax=Nannocystis exedens TaxID=54 RepID=A0A1I2H7E1_9BACT|nr:ACP S-malonyltransferase [Nannocystis exedens]PCC75829.1 Malonyl CoA-acyl carrier protein transacylase [Nannocystis exedens]SFF25498.1 [acyl-carrier-protein] S-malonyltransferase [Nannocystis exedens]
MKTTLVFMFPGQSSRYPGMLGKLARLHRRAAEVLAVCSDVLGRDLDAHTSEDNPTAFDRNVDVQVGVFVANHMMLSLLQAEGVDAELSLGLSLGEYNHLVHIGALELPEALRLVQARGEAYDAGPRGMMASVQPLDLETLEAVVEQIRGQGLGVLEIVNLNSPKQHVLSGDAAAVEAAVALLEDEHYVVPTIIERQVPMHSSLFEPVGAALRPHLQRARFKAPRLPYLPNRRGEFVPAPTAAEFVDLLEEHVHTPVLWRKSIDRVAERHPGAVFIEVGPRQVLHNLLDRKWSTRPKYATDSRDDAASHLAGVLAALRQHLPPTTRKDLAQEASWTS